jgi:Tol biopolymer transport system component
MKAFRLWNLVAIGCVFFATSCGSSKTYTSAYSPEESGLNVVKITDESKNTVLGIRLEQGSGTFTKSNRAGNKKKGISWSTTKPLSISPDGSELAYKTRSNKQQNIMVRRAGTGGAATQRTFRNVGDFTWGSDDNLYFIDMNDTQNKLCVINAHQGTLMRQLTSNNWDYTPVLAKDGKKVFFVRSESGNGPSVWSYELENGELTNCARGLQPVPLDNSDEFICVRNSDAGNSEIWRVNYKNGQEMLILSDKEKSFTHPTISPDGEWMLVVSNSVSSINKKKNLDLYACKIDGSNLVQLTYHPADDSCPQWSADGKSIYFLSDRTTKDGSFNVWRIGFNLR